MSNNLVNHALERGGSLTPLIIPSNLTNGTGTFNPSIYDDNGKLVVNIRHCQVTIYHSEKGIFEHQWGPLCYLNPENDITLTTTNYFCSINDKLLLDKIDVVDFSKLNQPPIWEFIGLEDCRVFRWDGDLYLCGVRRDTTTNGVGRMEMSKIEADEYGVRELSRFRMPAPGNDDSYCEKNWMPVLDMPYHFVKWCNPTEVVKVDPETKTTETVFLGKRVEKPLDYRGGSQVITVGNYRMAITHQTSLFNSEAGRKNAVYRHCFVIWDKNWNVMHYSEPFAFLDNAIEFCAGMALQGDELLLTFGVQDNAAYLLRLPMKAFEEFINAKLN